MRHRSTGVLAAAIAGVLTSGAGAALVGPSIAIKFAADQPGRTGGNSTVTGPAGVLNTVNWNNTSGESTDAANPSSGSNLIADVNGVSTPTAASVTWFGSAGEWSSTGKGEENNTATDQNGNLMAGYLDTGGGPAGVSITASGIPASIAGAAGATPYDVYVYIQGGVNGRGGTYALGSTTEQHTTTAAFGGTFIEDVAGEANQASTTGSNYLVFRNVMGTSFTVSSTVVTTRAPINAIEIVGKPVPEPASLGLFGLAAGGLLTRRRRPAAGRPAPHRPAG